MPRRSKYNLEAIRAAGNVECPYCNAILSPSEYLRLDYKQLRCTKCGKDFIPQAKDGPPMRTN
jgi:DNA-directed RNA polymerase subunit RPC12/RpoP